MNIFIATVNGQSALLTSEESWHCAKVLRKKAGDFVTLIDGLGNFFEGTLELVSEKQCRVKLTKGPTPQAKKNYFLHLAVSPTKQMDRVEWMLEKAIEIGVDELSFISAKNSERTVIKTERITKIIESAVKQSLQAYIPKINEIKSFKDIVTHSAADQKLIAHCYDGDKKDIKKIAFKNISTLILIGPEGDFSREEVELAEQNGFSALSLGTNRLRAETAGLYVCQAASLLS